MSRPLVVVVVWAAVQSAGCLPEYRPPRWDEPHAVVKVRLAYHDWPGPYLDQQVTIDQSSEVTLPTPVRTGSGVVTRAVLVRPGNRAWFFRSAFYHTYATSRTETYTTTQSYPCDTGTCSTDSVETRTVTEENRANDGTCSTGLALLARQNTGYILQYDFFGEGRCSLHCYREVVQPNGQLATAPCESPAPSSTERP